MIFFALNGQITINSIVGVVSFVIATIIIAYVVIKLLKNIGVKNNAK